MNNEMSLGIYFEIKDAELYGGKYSIGYVATIVGITANVLQKMDFAKYADRQREAAADMCKVPLENVRIISRKDITEGMALNIKTSTA